MVIGTKDRTLAAATAKAEGSTKFLSITLRILG